MRRSRDPPRQNNLQTVSALHLQSRRSSEDAVKVALAEAEHVRPSRPCTAVPERRVKSTSTESPRTIVRMAGAIAIHGSRRRVITTGNFGTISADQAQALATVLNELVANSVEAWPGRP